MGVSQLLILINGAILGLVLTRWKREELHRRAWRLSGLADISVKSETVKEGSSGIGGELERYWDIFSAMKGRFAACGVADVKFHPIPLSKNNR